MIVHNLCHLLLLHNASSVFMSSLNLYIMTTGMVCVVSRFVLKCTVVITCTVLLASMCVISYRNIGSTRHSVLTRTNKETFMQEAHRSECLHSSLYSRNFHGSCCFHGSTFL